MKNFDFSKLARPELRALRPYDAEEISCKVKLDANESPYPLQVPLRKTVLEKLNRYPDPNALELKKAVASRFRVRTENILLGNGSDELIHCLILAFGGPVLFPVPTFSMYGIIASALGQKTAGVPLDDNFDLDTPGILGALRIFHPKLTFLSSPNNPTGNCFSAERILKTIEASQGIVVVDEAYQPFSGGKGFLAGLKKYRNLAVLRTLSKVGFASLRVGILIADAGLVREVNKVRLPFNLNMLSQSIAVEAFRRNKQMDLNIKAVIAERKKLFRELCSMNGVTAYPSEANFVFFRIKNADEVYRQLLGRGILVRNLDDVVKDGLRVTVGTPAENISFIKALKTVIKNSGVSRRK